MSVNPSRSTVYIQRADGGAFKRLPDETIVSAPGGAGYNFDSDYALGEYLGTRFTANQSRVTLNLQVRREAVSFLRDLIGDGRNLFNLAILETDVNRNPVWDNFKVGSLLLDCGLTSRSVSANLADTTTVSDPKQLDTLAFSAGKWVEFHPVATSANLMTSDVFDLTALFYAIAYTEAALVDAGTSEMLVIGGQKTSDSSPALYCTFSKGDGAWSALPVTGLPAATAVRGVAFANNRLVVSTDSGIYHASLYRTPGNMTFTLSNGVLSTDAVGDIIAPEPGTIIAVSSSTDGRYFYSTDGGFSFTKVDLGGALRFTKLAAVNGGQVLVGTSPSSGTPTAAIYRIRNNVIASLINISPLTTGTITNTVAIPASRPNEVYVGAEDGNIAHCKDINAKSPAWELVALPRYTTSTRPIKTLQFSPDGSTLWIVAYAGGGNPYLLIDYSGGAAGAAVGAPVEQLSGNTTLLKVFTPQLALATGAAGKINLVE